MLLANTFLGMIGGPQIILIIAVVLLLFGGRKNSRANARAR